LISCIGGYCDIYTDPLESACCCKLPVDEQQLAALIHTEVCSITPATLKGLHRVWGFVTQIEQMSQQEQLLALRDLLTGAVLLSRLPVLDTNSRLAMWYQLAQGLEARSPRYRVTIPSLQKSQAS